MITKLSHATIYVLDHDLAYDFYVNKLGFDVRMDMKLDNGFRWLTVGPKNQPELDIVLFEVKEGGTMMSNEIVAQMRDLLHTGVVGPGVFQTDDCDASYNEFKERGVEFVAPPQDQFYGIEATFKDPFGNIFSLTQPK
ncbi:VOC family protein [Herpetosiphon giganteus]|uniref:VOC family protein n=1 Tax=Herpetosiphon giganteus TaxID=2029754 RepID=UPI00195CCCD4|nr:VOC family protein [Herpetosiphon giganteus]MBM7842594.1 putative enzyme related to lactoylglutathione lyase [Herpetosiphon giganteus]